RTGEWVYKDIKPRIIFEPLLSENDNSSYLTDYKIYCFNEEPHNCQVIKVRKPKTTIDFFATDWNHINFTVPEIRPNSTDEIKRSKKYKEMLNIAKEFSKEFPFVRVDF